MAKRACWISLGCAAAAAGFSFRRTKLTSLMFMKIQKLRASYGLFLRTGNKAVKLVRSQTVHENEKFILHAQSAILRPKVINFEMQYRSRNQEWSEKVETGNNGEREELGGTASGAFSLPWKESV